MSDVHGPDESGAASAPTEVEVLRRKVAVIMQRRAVQNRWQTEVWEPVGVLCEPIQGGPRQIVDREDVSQWLYPGFDVFLHRSEAEGYFHNVSSGAPCVFVLWRMEDGRAIPKYVTVSYDEATRWMDASESVDSVPITAELLAWMGEYVEKNYRREPRKRIRPQSFLSPKDRASR